MGSIGTVDTENQLFKPIKVGNVELKHRIVLAPLTRFRSTKKGHVPIVDLVAKYYSQRASTPGTLLITEATFIAPQGGGYDNVPGIWNDEQIEAWKKVCLYNCLCAFSRIDIQGRSRMRFIKRAHSSTVKYGRWVVLQKLQH